MPIFIVRQDITQMHTDAIVNPSNEELIPGGGVDEAIHLAAGPHLAEACASLGGCELGQAKLTLAFDLPCKYIIHTVGPIWRGGNRGERALLESCYTKSLQLAKKHGCKSIAFPLISSGTYGYPKDRVLRVAMDCIGEFLYGHEMMVYIVVYDKASFALSEELYSGVVSYIDDCYTGRELDDFCDEDDFADSECFPDIWEDVVRERIQASELCDDLVEYKSMAVPCAPVKSNSLEEALKSMDKGFSETLFDYIDAKGMTDVDCYKRANIDRKRRLLYLSPGVLPEHLDRWQRELLTKHRYIIQYAIL